MFLLQVLITVYLTAVMHKFHERSFVSTFANNDGLEVLFLLSIGIRGGVVNANRGVWHTRMLWGGGVPHLCTAHLIYLKAIGVSRVLCR